MTLPNLPMSPNGSTSTPTVVSTPLDTAPAVFTDIHQSPFLVSTALPISQCSPSASPPALTTSFHPPTFLSATASASGCPFAGGHNRPAHITSADVNTSTKSFLSPSVLPNTTPSSNNEPNKAAPSTPNNGQTKNGDPSESSGMEFNKAEGGAVYYWDYLELSKLLSCQKPISFLKGSPCHDEMLFVTIHQTYELWFKQLIFELDSVHSILAELNIGEKSISLALHRLTRIREIQKLLNDQMRVLETMMPQEFLEFRDYLFPASGFQSVQFRLLEIKLGVSPKQRLNSRWITSISPEHQELLREAQQKPSLFDYVERWLRNIPFREFRGYNFQKSYENAIEKMFQQEHDQIEQRISNIKERNRLLSELKKTFVIFQSVYRREKHEEMVKSGSRRMGFRATSASLMIMLYQEEPMFQLPARLLHMLIDVDEQMNQWRYNHSQMVHRMIGVKIGTGGSLGHSYLNQTIGSQKVFADLANLSTLLIPRSLLPVLPPEISDHMKYFHSVEKFDRTMFEMGGGGDEIDWSFC